MRTTTPIDEASLTTRIYNTFYRVDIVVGAAEYDIIYSFFAGRVKDQKLARTMTEALFRVASYSRTPVLALLDNLDQGTELELTNMMAYYLNSFGDKTRQYGINRIRTPNKMVQRNIIN